MPDETIPLEQLEYLLEQAWDDGNAKGFDGWAGPDYGEDAHPQAVRAREAFIRGVIGEVRRDG
ncbi:hypothetical protein [Nocardia aurea]|uniref:hypothetical protein n=1 Tax=Nocardia aurea TaxID=2144174 RepID=UPI00339DE960